MKKIIIFGANGFLGKYLSEYFVRNAWSVKRIARVKNHPEISYWDGNTLGDWQELLVGAEAVINLAGKSVNCRYTTKNKNEILSSRVNSTKIIGEAISKCKNPPKIWLNSSTATIYEDTRGELPANTESSRNIGSDFSMNVARSWESTFFDAETPNTIKTALRTAIVLAKRGGAFPVIRKLAKFGLNSKQASGDQWMSWISVEDFARSLEFIIAKKLEGIVNVSSPNPIKNKDFYKHIRQIKKPFLSIPQPEFLLKIGAFMMGTETELILKSRKVYPERLLNENFIFKNPTMKNLLFQIL